MITAILLAAGMSTRMGQPKQLLLYQERPLIRHVAENLLLSQVDEVIVVLGYQADGIRSALGGLPLQIVLNEAYELGLSSSLKAGLAACGAHLNADHSGLLFVLGDQPLLQPATVNLLIEEFGRHGGIVVPYCQGIRGNPVLFDQRYYKELSALKGDVGAREILLRYPQDVYQVEVSDQGVILDVDSWQDFSQLAQKNYRCKPTPKGG